MKRKEFIQISSAFIGATMLGCKALENNGKSFPNKIPTFDLHTHPGVFFTKGSERYPGEEAFVKRIDDMNLNGLDGAFFSLVADWPLLQITDTGVVTNGSFSGDEGWKVYKVQLKVLHDALISSNAVLAVSSEDLIGRGKVKAYIACEGGDFLGGKIDRVEEAYKDGVRSIQLVHYAPNDLGDLQTWKSIHGGLSQFGKEVVKEMNKYGMLIDVAHASARTVKDVVNLTSDPIMLSHSILKRDDNRPIGARAISADHAKMVSETGGIIGMWPSGFSSSFEEFVDATFRMLDVVGIDHVGMGTDMDANFKPVLSDYEGFQNWQKALKGKGLSNEEVSKLAGGNANRVLTEVIG